MILKVIDTVVDLYPSAEIFYTVQRVDIGSLTNRKVSFTNQFKAPWTPSNEVTFGFAKHEESPDPIIYTLRECSISNDGIDFSPSMVLYITKSDDQQFTLQIFETIFDFFMTVNDKKLSDIAPITSSGWNASDIDSARTNTDGIVSALIDWGVPIYTARWFMPSFYYHTIIKAILEDTGYAISGNILTDARFTELVIPYAHDKFEYPESYFRQFNFYNPRMGDQAVTGLTTKVIVFGQNVSVYQHGKYFARVSIGGITWNDGNNLFLVLEKNGDIVLTEVMARNPAPGASIEVEYETFIDDTDTFNFYIYSDAPTTGVDFTIVGGGGASSYMKFTADGVVNKNLVNWNQLFSANTAQDFLKDFFTRFGVIPKLEDNTIVLKTLEEIIADVAGSVDWSGKLVNNKQKEINFKSDYAQVNEFSYQNFADSPDLGTGSIDIENTTLLAKKTIYKSIFGNTNTVQYFSWNIARIPVFNGAADEIDGFEAGREISAADSIIQDDENDIINLIGTFDVTLDILDVDTEVILWNEGGGVVTLIEGAGLLIMGTTFDIPDGFYARIVWRIDDNPDIYLYPITESTVFATAPKLRLLTLKARTIENSITFDATPRTDYKIGYFIDETLTKDTGFQYFIDQFYTSLREALQKNKILLKQYNLVEQDVYEYDPHLMIYDGEGYYIINKLTNFKPERVTKSDLFKVF
jgi:hypothetical protein